jgi:hypothetical protein
MPNSSQKNNSLKPLNYAPVSYIFVITSFPNVLLLLIQTGYNWLMHPIINTLKNELPSVHREPGTLDQHLLDQTLEVLLDEVSVEQLGRRVF